MASEVAHYHRLALGRSNSTAQKKKEEAKLKMVQLFEKRKKEATEKAEVEHAGKEA